MGCLLVVAALLLWPFGTADLGEVPPELPFHPPYAQVEVDYYLDGGSIGIQVVDNQGTTNLMALPARLVGNDKVYTNLVFGTVWVGRTNTPGIPLTKELKNYLVALIEQHGSPEMHKTIALSELRGAPRDYLRVFNYVVRTKVMSQEQ